MSLIVFGLISIAWLVHLLPQPFHEDEAIYAAWSLQILRGDFWLSSTPIDKPPLTFYPIAASVALFGRHEWAARLPNVAWTGLLLVALWRITEAGGRRGWMAVGLALCSPLLWAMGASAFTDVAMVALAMVALERGLKAHPAQAGVVFALALLAKPTGIFLAPLVLLNLRGERSWARFVWAGAVPLLVAWAWDASRTAPSWWALGRNAYGSLGQGVGQVGEWVFVAVVALGGMGLAGGVLRGLGPGLPVKEASHKSLLMAVGRASPYGDARDAGIRGDARWRWILLGTLGLWVPVHVALGFQAWERYLLPMVVIGALWVAAIIEGARLAWPAEDYATLHPRLQVSPSPAGIQEMFGLGRFIGLGVFAVMILGAPVLVERVRLEPHDGGWQGVAEIGAEIEALPAEATVFYVDMGRPLAWYAADAEATLVWGGANGEAVRETLEEYERCPCYLAVRRGETLPVTLGVERTIQQSGHFRLVELHQ